MYWREENGVLLGGDPLDAAPQVIQGAGAQDGGHLHAAIGQQLPRGPELEEGKLTQSEVLLALGWGRYLVEWERGETGG